MVSWDERSEGVEWRLELERDVLLPGRLVAGRVTVRAARPVAARELRVTLRSVEQWRHKVTQTDADGQVSTRVVTSRADAATVPVQVRAPLELVPGLSTHFEFELPVPPLGPATLEAREVRLGWTIEAKLDIPGGLDSRIERPIAVAQPKALLAAGAVRLGQFALFESADVARDGITGSIRLGPAPLVRGEPFRGAVMLAAPGTLKLQEIRVELRARVKATVNGGMEEDIHLLSGQLSPSVELGGERTFELDGTLPPTFLPSVELPHGRSDVTFRVILAKAWAPDIHLIRDVAVATTDEL